MSRELDAQVAEKVMGYGKVTYDKHGNLIVTNPPSGVGTRYLMCYSTSIAAAWLVVEKMIAQVRNVRVQYSTGYGTYMCHVTRPDVCVTATTAPEAICRAALKAVTP